MKIMKSFFIDFLKKDFKKMLKLILKKISLRITSLFTMYPFWISWGLGLIASLSMPPIHAWFLLPFAFSGFLVILEKTSSSKKAFSLGWIFGFGYFLGGLYWLGNAPLTVGIWLAVPFASIGLPLLLSFFPAFASYFTFRSSQTPLARVFAFSAFWSVFEWLRGHIFTGFPWNLLGYTWDISILQVTSLIGIYGLTALTVLAASIFFSRHKGWISGLMMTLIAVWLWGDYRLTQSLKEDLRRPTPVNLRIVQASIPQQTKWLVQNFQENLKRYVALSHLPAEKSLSAIIWPESSLTTFVENVPALLNILREAVPQGGLLLFGAPREVQGNLKTSMLCLNDQGKVVETYDKAHLVPFGEYMPFRSILSFKKLTYGDRDYTPGVGVRTLDLPGLPKVSPLICYEAIFPHAVINHKSKPEWMLNLTNDAWYGLSPGPHQHLQIVRVRAIEEGMPFVRAANNGISAVIDSFGRILHRLELNEIGFIDFSLPQHLNYDTLHQQWGDLLFVGLFLMFFGLSISYRFHQK